ncbi:DUF927 domain-containing protein [Lysinibacillus fusiformis]|uniref:DUF927 domain-containing protein n=1 Tax=Lysinibacillus fusiformis TaxID=28031 RepID=UPI0037A9504C
MCNQKINLLKEWFSQSEGYVEFRLIGAEGLKDQRFVAVEDLTDKLLVDLSEKGEQEQLNVYHSVTTRKIKEGKEADVFHVPGLWLDIDPKHATYEEAMQIVKSLPTPPTATVSSGNGIHAYFKFNEPFEVVDDQAFKFIKELSIKLHTFTKADDTADLARLLRVPNSLNVKNLMDVKPCSLVDFTGATYSLDSFTYLDDVKIQSVDKSVETIEINEVTPIGIDDLKVSFKQKSLIVDGPQHDEDRSKKIFHVVIELLKANHTHEEIAFVLINEEWAIGEKISDRPKAAQLKYIEGVIKNATKALKDGQDKEDVEKLLDSNECSIYEHDNCYYEKQSRLSNFIFVPVERVHANKDEYLKGHIALSNGETLSNIVLTPKAFSSKKGFIEEINSTKISWLGGDKHLQYLKELFMTKEIVDRYAVNKIGLHNNLFITPTKVINSKGIVENSQYIYMPKLAEGQMDFELSMNILSFEDWKELAKKVLPLLVQINEEAVINTIIGWHFVAPVVPLLRKYTDNAFPQLMIWGTQSAGKTSTAQLFGKLFGNPEVRSCTRPAFSITREVDLLNGVPLYLDEFRPHNMSASNWKGLKNLALNAYKAALDSRGNKNQGTITYRLTAPIVWLGETGFEESNMLERLIIAQLTPNTLSKSDSYKQAFKKLNALNVSGFMMGYVQWLLHKIEHDDIRLSTLYEHYKEVVDSKYNLHERPLSNIAMVLIGVVLFNELANEMQVNCTIDQHIVIEEQVSHFNGNKVHTALQNLFKHTVAIVQSNNYEFKDGVHYTYNASQHKLTIAKDMWFPAVRKYMKDHDYVDERFSDKQIKNLLKENKDQLGFILDESASRTVGGKSTRCYVIDTQRLEEELGISKDMWEQRFNF